MRKIIVICLNTAIDQIVYLDTWKYGGVLRSVKSVSWASGKGVNSARALSNIIKSPIELVGLVGRESANFFNSSALGKVNTSFLQVPGNSRTNLTIATVSGELVSHIQTQGFTVTKAILREVIQMVKQLTSEGDIILLSGSLPRQLMPDTYQILIATLKKLGAIVLFDAGDDELLAGLEAAPFFVKPNLDEFEYLIGKKLDSKNPRSIAIAIKSLKGLTADHIAVSLGKDGVFLYQTKIGKMYFGNVATKTEYSTLNEIGCGDSFMAGIAYGLSLNHPMVDCVKLGNWLWCSKSFFGRTGCHRFHYFGQNTSSGRRPKDIYLALGTGVKKPFLKQTLINPFLLHLSIKKPECQKTNVF